jgi:hypothetical protein
MPCDDVTEVLRIELDPDDRVRAYELNKRTCGRAVGERSLLAEWATGRAAAEVLVADIDAFLHALAPTGEAEEFLVLKHFFALRMGLAVLVGREPGGATDPCAVASLAHGPEGTELIAHLRVEVLTEQIRSCGRCGKGCGTRRPAATAHQ